MESPFEASCLPREEVPTTSSEPEVHLDDVIEWTERISFDEDSTPYQSTDQPRPSHKGPP
jgi:hypothetical protein